MYLLPLLSLAHGRDGRHHAFTGDDENYKGTYDLIFSLLFQIGDDVAATEQFLEIDQEAASSLTNLAYYTDIAVNYANNQMATAKNIVNDFHI